MRSASPGSIRPRVGPTHAPTALLAQWHSPTPPLRVCRYPLDSMPCKPAPSYFLYLLAPPVLPLDLLPQRISALSRIHLEGKLFTGAPCSKSLSLARALSLWCMGQCCSAREAFMQASMRAASMSDPLRRAMRAFLASTPRKAHKSVSVVIKAASPQHPRLRHAPCA